MKILQLIVTCGEKANYNYGTEVEILLKKGKKALLSNFPLCYLLIL